MGKRQLCQSVFIVCMLLFFGPHPLTCACQQVSWSHTAFLTLEEGALQGWQGKNVLIGSQEDQILTGQTTPRWGSYPWGKTMPWESVLHLSESDRSPQGMLAKKTSLACLSEPELGQSPVKAYPEQDCLTVNSFCPLFYLFLYLSLATGWESMIPLFATFSNTHPFNWYMAVCDQSYLFGGIRAQAFILKILVGARSDDKCLSGHRQVYLCEFKGAWCV